MATTYGSLEHIFKKPLPRNPTLIESLSSWKPVRNPVHDSTFMEIFGEFHYKESPVYSCPNQVKLQSQYSDGFSSMSSESLSLCTEELGSESSGDVEDLFSSGGGNDKQPWDHEERRTRIMSHCREAKRPKTRVREFPPPLPCVGDGGTPWVGLKSSRVDGRFILEEAGYTQEFLRVYREDGRLMLKIVYPESDDEIEVKDFENFEDGVCRDEGSGNGGDMIEVSSNIHDIR